VNLASEDPVLSRRSLRCVREELRRCEALGVEDLVIHPGAHADVRRGIRRIARALDRVHRSFQGKHARVCLEVTAGQGNAIGHRLEQLEEILMQSQFSDRIGICLDTCHLHAAGYDLVRPRGYESTFREVERRLGLSRVRCFHLNDSKKGLGCRVDRHEEIGRGSLGLAPFRRLVNDARFRDTVAVLETPFPERYAEAIALLEGMDAHRHPKPT
jgi:deoxyribonuclease-4